MAALLLLLSGFLLHATFTDAACKFPSRWEGEWFQSGVRQPIVIEGDRASSKGRCLASEGDKFLVVDDKGLCYRCVVIHEKHPNVLQYKETYCHGRSAELGTLCTLITGDALLYSMFRVAASPVACPFRGSFSFSYNRGHGECAAPASSLQQCTEDWRVLLSFHACPDLAGTESSVEELSCLATWKEGSARYLVGRLRHRHATSDEERYRCFVYEKAGGSEQVDLGPRSSASQPSGPQPPLPGGTTLEQQHVDFWVAQSGDATCNGLFTPMEGSRTLKLKKVSAAGRSCRLPAWLSAHAHWHTLDHRLLYHVTHRNSTLRIIQQQGADHDQQQQQQISADQEGAWPRGGSAEARLACTELRSVSAHRATIVAHLTHGCQSGFVCLAFYRRDPHVVELQTGSMARRSEEACSTQHFDSVTLPYTTLVTSSPESRECPHAGRFSVQSSGAPSPPLGLGTASDSQVGGTNCAPDFTSLAVGCAAQDTMEFRFSSECQNQQPLTQQQKQQQNQQQPAAAMYSCHGGWEDNGTHFLITTPLSRTSHGARRLCFMFRSHGGAGGMLLASSAASCSREPHQLQQHHLTAHGECLVASSAPPLSNPLYLLILVLVTALLALPSLRLSSHS